MLEKLFKRRAPVTVMVAPADAPPRRVGWQRLFERVAPFINRPAVQTSHEVVVRFTPPKLLPGVLPDGYAQDSDYFGVDSADNAPVYAFANSLNCSMHFPGYSYLSQLQQRSEFRAPCEVISKEMVRRWIRFVSKSQGDKKEKIAQLTAAAEKFDVRNVLRLAIDQDYAFGRAQIYVHIKNQDTPEGRKLPLVLDPATVPRDSLMGFKVIEAIWTTPYTYNALDPTAPDFFKPSMWSVLGKQTHESRLLMVQTRPVPDILKPSYNFGGVSMSQLMEPYVNEWITTRTAVAQLIHNFSVMILKTDLQTILQGGDGGDTDLLARAKLFTLTRDNQGLTLINKDTEEMDQVAVPLSGLHELQAQAQEHMAAPCHIPLVKLTGVTPAGLNANSDGEIRVFYDFIHSEQESSLRPVLTAMLGFIQLSEFGAIDDDLSFEFVELSEPTAKEVAEVRKSDAASGVAYIAAGVISPEEERERLMADPSSGYNNLTGAPPDPPEEPGAEGDDDKPAQDAWNESAHPRGEHGRFGNGGEKGSKDTTHLVALMTRLSHEKERYEKDKSPVRAVWITQVEKEIAKEKEFIGLNDDPLPDMSDEDLLKELGL